MVAQIIDGKAFAVKLRQEVAQSVKNIQQQSRVTPGLAVVLVGEDPASQVYVRNKAQQTAEVGMHSYKYLLDTDISEQELLDRIGQLNNDDKIHGILVQLPLPRHIHPHVIINAIDPKKDVDGLHIENVGRLSTGLPALIPCTPLGVSLLLQDYLGDISGKVALVIGRSNLVGKPVVQLLLQQGATVTLAHSRTTHLPELIQASDIVIAAVGQPEMIQGEWIKRGSTVIDVGINRVSIEGTAKTKIVGDVHFDSAVKKAGYITPVPGGVGPMTIACLLRNTVTACQRIIDDLD